MPNPPLNEPLTRRYAEHREARAVELEDASPGAGLALLILALTIAAGAMLALVGGP